MKRSHEKRRKMKIQEQIHLWDLENVMFIPKGKPTTDGVLRAAVDTPLTEGLKSARHTQAKATEDRFCGAPRAIFLEHSQHSSSYLGREDLTAPPSVQPRHRTFASSALSSSASVSVRPSTAGAWAATAVSTGTSVMESESRPLLGEFRLISARDKMWSEKKKKWSECIK